MKYTVIFLALFTVSCTTPISVQKSCYAEISKQEFISIVLDHPSDINFMMVYYYAGSDADYDYIYGFIPGVFPGRNTDFHYYKLKVGTLNLSDRPPSISDPPTRFDFGVPKKDQFLISNDRTDAQSRVELEKILKK